MVSVNDVVVSFGGYDLLDQIRFMINPRDRIGLVGKNGAGKSTLMKIIAGIQKPTSGSVSVPSGINVGYLPQIMQISDTTSLMQETMKAFARVQQLEAQLEKLNKELLRRDDYESDSYARLIQQLADANEHYHLLGGDNREGEAEKTLLGLGFKREDFGRPTSEFSGGWRMRIELAKILLVKPELLLLDEPTNHLDIESIEWLEEYLQSYPGALVLISHDRAFLDNITTRTIEILLSKVYDYDASYSKYVVLRQERREQQLATYRNQQKMIEKTEDFIERFRYKATKSNQVQSRIKQLNKIERIEVDEEDTSALNMRFPKAPRSGNVVFLVRDLAKKYGSYTVFTRADMEVERGQKVALVGRNGEGKSTLLKILMGQIPASAGTAQLGHQVNIGYFAQNQDDLLDPDETVFDTMDRVAVGDVRTRLRDILGAFLFRGEDIDKKVKVLSGGERSRLAMARLMLEPYNLLVLDEPTNHLDMRSKDILKQALLAYDGTVIVVSHDREFLDGLVSKIYEFRDGRVKEHLGGIYDFLRRKKLEHLNEIERKTVVAVPKEATKVTIKEKEPEKKTAEPVKPTTQQNFQQKKEYDKQLRKLRSTVEKIEQEIEQIDLRLAEMNQTLSQNPQAADDMFYQNYNAHRKKQEDAFWEWEKAHQAVEMYLKNNA